MHKLQKVSVLSVDELELQRFLSQHKFVSKAERKYLTRYVLKGLPESVRGKVRRNLRDFYLVLAGMFGGIRLHQRTRVRS